MSAPPDPVDARFLRLEGRISDLNVAVNTLVVWLASELGHHAVEQFQRDVLPPEERR